VENYQCHITIDNRTTEHIRLLKKDTPWGVFKAGPVADIGPKLTTVAFVATGKPGLPGGAEGTVTYQVGDDANQTVAIYYDIPATPFTSNTVRVDTSSDDIVAQLTGFRGDGSTESCIVKLK
jgi:hypothetical protein